MPSKREKTAKKSAKIAAVLPPTIITCTPPGSIDLILQTFTEGQPVVLTVNEGALEGKIVKIMFKPRTLAINDVSGTYFIPFDNIDYIQALPSAKTACMIKKLQKLSAPCDFVQSAAEAIA